MIGETRREIKSLILGMVGGGASGAGSSRAPGVGGPGLFGPRSVVRRVHGDVTAMMIGGVGALLLQMLHPGALGGVWDHTDFRGDMAGRLKRTARFISLTTYGSRAQAEAAIAQVRAIHDRISGVLPDGSSYHAQDPELLTFVHVAEVSSFLKAHLRHREPLLPPYEQDRYFAEVAIIAELLGAGRAPSSRAEVRDYLAAIRPKLGADDRTRTVADALLSQAAPNRALAPAYEVLRQSGIDLLPGWAAEMHSFRRSLIGRRAAALGAFGVGSIARWAMSDPRTV